MKDYVLNKQPEPASNETVWAFDLGKGSIGDFPSPRWGEGGRSPDEVNPIPQFLHKASLLIPAEFWKIKMGLFRLRGSPVWKSSFTLRLAAWLFPTIDTARLVLIRQKFSKPIL
jgi:hypothetical protein